MHSADYTVARCLSIRLSGCRSRTLKSCGKQSRWTAKLH